MPTSLTNQFGQEVKSDLKLPEKEAFIELILTLAQFSQLCK